MTDRRVLTGTGIGRRAAYGPVARMAAPLPEPAATPVAGDPATELARARAALHGVAAELRARAGLAGGDAADVLSAQALMAEDPALDERVRVGVGAGSSAARAIFDGFATYRAALATAGPYLAARVADLDDVRQRAVAACLGVPVPGVPDPGHPFVLVAHDLAPADTAGLDLSTVVAIVTREGGPTSHTAVLARSRGIPAVLGCAGATGLAEGDEVLVDPARSTVIVAPTATDRTGATTDSPVSMPAPTTPGGTADGYPVALMANIGRPDEAVVARAAGAEGVGLYRTEFLFLDADQPPDEAAQVAAYRTVFAEFAGQRVVVRILDAGADKPLRFLPRHDEPNPALGIRGLRALREAPRVLDAQLAAIGTAARAAEARVWVMAPMVADPAEASWFVARVREHGLATAGVMVEIPSAALLADQVLARADFASIGTNDLAQYALAADRQIGALAALADPWHPALLRLVAMVGAAGARTGKPVGVCGEAAADPMLACVLVGLGVTSLSMAPAGLAEVRDTLRRFTIDECRAQARRALGGASAAESRTAAQP